MLNLDNDVSRRTVEQCYRTRKTLLNPIIDWLDDDVWEFIGCENVSYCGMYDCGYKRLGCIGCPLSSNAKIELEQHPKYKAAYIRAFEKMIVERKGKGLTDAISGWNTGEEVMDWWLNAAPKMDENKLSLFGEADND